MRRLVFVLALLAPAACKKAPPPAAKPAAEAGATLRQAVEALPVVQPCASVVASGWATSWPVPAGGGPARYAVFFYPLGGDPVTGPTLGAPAAKAVFDAQSGTVASCEALPAGAEPPPPGQRWPAAASGLDMKGFQARAATLYAATEAVAAAYAAGNAASPAAKDFWTAFDGLAEPAFRGEYYRLDPAFWEWLRAAAGASLEKPKR